MSNKIVPSVYRTVIDQVISSVRLDFDELAIDEEILALLQQKWESKLLASHVAEFEPPPPPHLQSHHPMHVPVPTSGQYRYQQQLKNEQQGYPQQNGGPSNGAGTRPYPPNGQQQPNGQWNGGLRGGAVGGGSGSGMGGVDDGIMRLRGGNGEEEEEADDSDESSSSSGSSPRKPLVALAPPPPIAPAVPYVPNENGIFPGDEKIDSDLDDSEDDLDDEDEEGGGGEQDPNENIVFCVYDKVQRVKNKWKMVFRDGMGHVNGKDYLFSKCSSDFEW